MAAEVAGDILDGMVRWLLAALAALTGGCVQRTLTIESDPPGALVCLNDREVGRTPFKTDFLWYGHYEVILRKEGYETLKTARWVNPPWWQIVPIDLAAEALPLHDRQTLRFTMRPASTQPTDADLMIERASRMREQLEASR